VKIIFSIILAIHSIIHFIWFSKAFELFKFTQLTKEISRPISILWLAATLLFLTAIVKFFLKSDNWWIIGMIAAILSQVLIFMMWKDAKFGTIVNLLMLVVAFFCYNIVGFEKTYKKDIKDNIQTNNSISTEILTESDIEGLPQPVQRYLRYSGAVSKARVKNMRVDFDVQMRGKGKEFMKYTSEQFNFFDEPTRLFFMKGKMFGLEISGYHRFSKGVATMDIRLLGLVKVVNISGGVLNKTETVTLFNDMCLMAPATLIDKRIKWEDIDSNSSRAYFTNRGITISATLFFNDDGQLIDFASNDRTEVTEMKQMQFTTPVSDYRNINGINIWTKGEAVWEYPDGKFTYGKFVLKGIRYNCN
jgi:hypothetical protein